MSDKPKNRLRSENEPNEPTPNPKPQKSDFDFQLPQKKYLIYAAAAIFVLIIFYAISQVRKPSKYQTFLTETRVEQKIEEKKYDSALMVLDSAVKNSALQKDMLKINEMRNNVLKLKFEKEAASKNLFAECVTLMKEFRFDEAFSKSEQAIAAGAIPQNDKATFQFFSEQIRSARDSFQKNTVFKMPISHKVKAGENLGILASKYAMKVSEIKKLNNISADWIREGQQITVWGAAKMGEHTVEAGDNITSIAAKYKMSVTHFKLINQLETDVIRKGQKLKTISYLEN